VGKNMLFLSEKQLEQELMNLFPELQAIQVKKLYPRAIQVGVITEKIVARLKSETSGEEFILMKNGVILQNTLKSQSGTTMKESPNDIPNFIVPKYEFGKEIPESLTHQFHPVTGTRFITPERLQIILVAMDLFRKNFQVKMSTVSYLPLEEELHLKLDNGTKVLLWLDRDVETQLFKLKQAESKIDVASGQYAYIDLRIKDRVDTCKKGGQCSM